MRSIADSRAKGDDDLVGDLLRTGQDIRFPESQDGPAVVTEDAGLMAIAFNVALYLRDPVRRIVTSAELREPSLQISTVPEVTVAEDHEAVLREHDVGAAGQSWNVEAVAKTAAPELTSKGELAAGVRLAAGASRRFRRILGSRVQARERWGAAMTRLHRRTVYHPGWSPSDTFPACSSRCPRDPNPAHQAHRGPDGSQPSAGENDTRRGGANMRFGVGCAFATRRLLRGRTVVVRSCP